MSTPPLLSVVIPTCNRHASLAACLEQLAPGRQTLPVERYEVIVSDDGALASAEPMLRERFPWARWTPGPRRGPAANRNRGAREAAGSWLAFTDDDCLPDPGWLAALAGRIGRPDCPRVLEGRTTDGGDPPGTWRSCPANETGGFLWSCNLALERGLFFELGGFDEKFPSPHLEDVDLRLRLQDGGHRWEFLPAALVVHPPRPLKSVASWARSQESYFHLARKRGVPLAAVGLGPGGLVRAWWHGFRACRTGGDLGRMAVRCSGEALLLAAHLPGWWWQHRAATRAADKAANAGERVRTS